MEDIRLFWFVEGRGFHDFDNRNEEIFATQYEANEYAKKFGKKHPYIIGIAEVRNYYWDEQANGWNYDDQSNTFDKIITITTQTDTRTDADKLTEQLIAAGADRAKVIAIIDGYGDPIDWNYHSLDSIVAEVWQSDLNSGDEPDGWIINEICRTFNLEEVTE